MAHKPLAPPPIVLAALTAAPRLVRFSRGSTRVHDRSWFQSLVEAPLTIRGSFSGVVLFIAASSTLAQPVFADRAVGRVRTSAGPGARDRPLVPVAGRTRCIGVDHVAGAIVFGDRAVEMTMNDGARWRMVFAQACPALSFYQGFYYRRAIAGRLCAGRDAVIARSGGECLIAGIILVKKPKRGH